MLTLGEGDIIKINLSKYKMWFLRDLQIILGGHENFRCWSHPKWRH